jgi:N-acetylneuraminate synthase
MTRNFRKLFVGSSANNDLLAGGCLLVGEVAQAHDGSVGMAHAFIDAIAAAGADAVKFQTHIADAESTLAEPWRVKFSVQDTSRYEYWKRMEFTVEQWSGLKRHADERGLLFISSPFSIEAVHLLQRAGVAAWKIASGEVSNTPMFEEIVATGLPVLLSTGMSSMNEIDEAVLRLKDHHVPFAVMQCTSVYPCAPEKVGLNLLQRFRERYDCAVGLSDHSGTIYPGLAGATMGIEVLEVHVTLSREMFGPDVPVSVTTSELRQLLQGIRFIERMMSNPVDKDEMAEELTPIRELFSKSVVARINLLTGTVLRADHLKLKKPGSGLPPTKLPELIGARLKRSIRANELLHYEDLEVASFASQGLRGSNGAAQLQPDQERA